MLGLAIQTLACLSLLALPFTFTGSVRFSVGHALRAHGKVN